MATITLRDGSATEHPRLDRLVQFDERSRRFPITAVVPTDVRSKTWVCQPRLDQGDEGACVGFGITHELAASPVPVRGLDAAFAREAIYWAAQKIDPWAGGAYPGASPQYEGTSVLAGMQAAQSLGYFAEYRWAFGIDDVLRAVSHAGPVVMGTVWREGMFEPRPSGLLTVEDSVAGGHCWLLRGLILKPRLRGERLTEPVVRCRNSWGAGWGAAGDFFLRVSDLEALLADDGEAAVPMGRARP